MFVGIGLTFEINLVDQDYQVNKLDHDQVNQINLSGHIDPLDLSNLQFFLVLFKMFLITANFKELDFGLKIIQNQHCVGQ